MYEDTERYKPTYAELTRPPATVEIDYWDLFVRHDFTDLLRYSPPGELKNLVDAPHKPLACVTLNFYDDLAWLMLVNADEDVLTDAERDRQCARMIRKKTSTFRYRGEDPEQFDKDLYHGALALCTWSGRTGKRFLFAVIEVTDIVDDTLMNLFQYHMDGHEYYGDGELCDLVEFYRRCYPDEDITEDSVFRVLKFRVVRTFFDPDTLFRLYSGDIEKEPQL